MIQMFESNPAVFVVSLILQIIFVALGTYYFGISLFAWFNRKELPDIRQKDTTFAIVVAAHNEEAVIANLIESLMNQNYDRRLYDVFVVADNCTDRTAELARAAGAFCHERTNDEERGKGFALEWMFAKLFKMEKKYDSIAIFDADNIVDPDFLAEMNKKQRQGYRVVQGYIDSKNPFDSWITASYTISFWCINKLFQLSRANLGLSCQLCGTGFVVDSQLIKEIGWESTCLTEDMEFTMRLVLNNHRVGFSSRAVVFDEKPITLAQSWKQRVRWMQGHTDVASRFTLPLVKKAIAEKSWRPIDCVIYLVQPLRIVVMGLITLMALIQNIYPHGNLGFFQVWYLFKNPAIWNTFVFMQFAYTPMVIWLEKRQFNLKLITAYLTYFIYSLTWVPITIVGISKKNSKEWFHTKHTRQISIAQMKSKK